MLLSRFAAFQAQDPQDIIAVSRAGGSLLQQAYADQMRTHELLKGAAVSFLILAVGSFAEFSNAGGHETVVWLATLSAIVLAGLSLLFSRRAIVHATALATAARKGDTA